MKQTNFCYPEYETWFICFDNEGKYVTAYGSIRTTQCMDTPWNEVDYYLDEQEWKDALAFFGIIVDDTEIEVDDTEIELS